MAKTHVFEIVEELDRGVYIILDRKTGDACLCNYQTILDLITLGHYVNGLEIERGSDGKIKSFKVKPCKSVKLPKDFKCFVAYRLRNAKDTQYGIKVERITKYADNKVLNCLVNFLYNRTGLLFTLNSGKATSLTESECRVNIDLLNNGKTFNLDYFYIPEQYRGKMLSNRVMKTLIEYAKIQGCTEFVLYPFPSDLCQAEKQGIANINKLIRFYKKFGFKLSNEADFKNFFSY